jgi:hypothetical protein
MLPELTAYGKGTIQGYKLHRPPAKKLGNTYNQWRLLRGGNGGSASPNKIKFKENKKYNT